MADNVSVTPTGATPIATDEIGGVHFQRVKMTSGADGVATDVSTANPLPVSAKITNGTTDAGMEPFGALLVHTGSQTLFYEAWSTNPIDTTEKWTVTGTTPGIAVGMMTMVATPSTYNAIQTKDAVRPNVGFTLVRNGISIETTTTTGAGRFWGLGTPATVPAANKLAQDGIGFELDQATGSLLAVTYAAGVRTTVATLTRPVDGAIHAYGTYFRVTQAYWLIDGVIVASQSFPNVQVVDLPALIVRQNAASFTGTPAFVNIAHLTADTSRQSAAISDSVIGTRQARVTAQGRLRVESAVVESFKATYSAATGAFTPPATPTDLWTLVGSATKTVRILRIEISATQTTAGTNVFALVKRSAANTAGTRVAGTAVPHDSTNAAATASPGHYTANPSALGTAVGTVRSSKIFTPAPATAAGAQSLAVFDFESGQMGQNLVLRGVAECLALNFNGAALPAGLSVHVNVEWTEES